MKEQEDQEFTDHLRSKAEEAKRDLKFPATKFIAMLNADGGYATAQKLLAAKRPSSGFTDLWTHGRLDLSVEAIVVESKWRTYFADSLIELAENRLRESKYAFKPFVAVEHTPVPERLKPNDSDIGEHNEGAAPLPDTGKTSITARRRYWWVNQNQTYKSEVPGGFLWSPKSRADGGRNQFYENMTDVEVGDIIFSFCDTRIKAIGVATGKAESTRKPDFGGAGTSWAMDGWLVPVEFKELQAQIRPKDHIALIRAHLPKKYSPLQASGDGLQSVYLASVPAAMADVLIELIGPEFDSTLLALTGEENDVERAADQEEDAIKGRTDIGETNKIQLIKSRRGQGIFKANVRLNEKGCRITGVTDPRHLRASHIKPWKDSNDEEKLNGCNGLLLAPHVDHLFDKGFISFAEDGSLLVSPQLDSTLLTQWGLSVTTNVGKFNQAQIDFLKYHMHSVFRR